MICSKCELYKKQRDIWKKRALSAERKYKTKFRRLSDLKWIMTG
jgi:hypothetical protein